jgi:hypothetical protein
MVFGRRVIVRDGRIDQPRSAHHVDLLERVVIGWPEPTIPTS